VTAGDFLHVIIYVRELPWVSGYRIEASLYRLCCDQVKESILLNINVIFKFQFHAYNW
jgi:hypothetical protein